MQSAFLFVNINRQEDNNSPSELLGDHRIEEN